MGSVGGPPRRTGLFGGAILANVLSSSVACHCTANAFPDPVTSTCPVLRKLVPAIIQSFCAVLTAKLLTNRGVQGMCWYLAFVFLSPATLVMVLAASAAHIGGWNLRQPVSIMSSCYDHVHWSCKNSCCVLLPLVCGLEKGPSEIIWNYVRYLWNLSKALSAFCGLQCIHINT